MIKLFFIKNFLSYESHIKVTVTPALTLLKLYQIKVAQSDLYLFVCMCVCVLRRDAVLMAT